MQDLSAFIIVCGKGYPSDCWKIAEIENVQRIHYIIRGEGSVTFDNKNEIKLLPGKLYLMPSNLRPSFSLNQKAPVYHIYFDFYTAPPIIANLPIIYDVKKGTPLFSQLSFAENILPERNKRNVMNFGRIKSAENGSSEERMQIYHTLLNMLLLLLNNEKSIPFVEDESVITAVNYIHKNYRENINVGTLAELSGYNKDHFTRRFKSVMGTTPHAYLKNHRITLAQNLILAGMTISAASKEVGYENPVSLYNIISKNKAIKKLKKNN